MTDKKKLFIVTTVPMSFVFFKGQLLVLRKKFDITLISSPEQGLYETANLNDVKCYGIKMSREISLLSDVVSLFKLLFYFIKNKPDILHANTPKGSFLSLATAWLCKVPTRIYYVHGLRYQGEIGLKQNLLIKMEKLSCFFATDIVAVSNGVKNHLHQDFITTKGVTVIWNGSINGIDLDYFDPTHPDVGDIRTDHSIQEHDFVFGFLGRLVGDKGINELISAFEKLNLEYSNIKLLLVGNYEADLDPLHQETLLSIQTNPNIIHVGFQEDVRPYLKAMDLFVFPSYREGFGISIMEAAAMNVPAISSNITGCNEIIEDGINGFLIPVKNKEAIYLKMKYSIENRIAVSKMSAVIRTMIKDKFEQQKLWSKIVTFYEHIKH